MATNFIVNPAAASFDLIKAGLNAFLLSRPDAAKWEGFFDSQVGTTVIELVAGMGAFMKYDNITSRREAFGQYAQNRSSVIGYGQGMGYSAFRGRNKIFKLSVIPNTTGLLSKYFVVGSAQDGDLILLEDTVVNTGVPVDLTVVVGTIKTEDVQATTIAPTAFRFSNPLVSSDIRVRLNGDLVDHSEHILDMINEKFVAISNVNDSVDVFYLNLTTFLTQYSVGDTLTLEYVERKDWQVGVGDIVFGLGTLSSATVVSVFEDVEEIESVRINAPLFNETQFVIRGRSDYAKSFKLLSSDIVDTNYKDISAAVVELYAAKNDNSVFTTAEKATFVQQLSAFRPMGLLPPIIKDPTIVFLELSITLTLDPLGGTGNPDLAVETVLSTYENKLGIQVSFPDIENHIDDNQFIKISRIKINSSPWAPTHQYVRGGHVHPIIDNGKVYEAIKFLNFSGTVEPVWPLTPGATIEDGDLLWQQCGLVGPCDVLSAWTPTTAHDLGDEIVPTVSNTFKYCLVDFIHRSASSIETQHIAFSLVPTSGTWRLEYNNGVDPAEATTDFAYNDSASTVAAGLNALTALSGVSVTGNYASGFDVTFGGADANKTQPQLTLNAPGQNEIDCIFFDITPNVGTFRLDFGGQQTGTLAYNINNADLQTALEGLSTIGSGNVQVDAGIGGEIYRVQFKGALGLRPLPGPITVFNDSLFAATPVSASVALIQDGASPNAGSNETQKIVFSLLPNAGDFTINFNTQTTTPIPYNASASDVQTALIALSNLAPGDVTVTGNMSIGFTLAFAGAYVLTDVPQVTIPSNTLVLLTPTTIATSTTTAGGGGFNEVQHIVFSAVPTAGSFRLQFSYLGAVETTDIQTVADVTNSLRSTYWFFDTPTFHYYVWYKVSGVGTDPGPFPGRVGIQVNISTNDTATTVQTTSVSAINTAAAAVVTASSQPNNKIRLTNVAFGSVADATPQSSNFIVTIIQQGVDTLQQTSLMSFNSTAATLQTLLEGLVNIGPNNILVTGNFAQSFIVEFRGALANTDVPQITASDDTLTTSQNVAITPQTTIAGASPVAGINEVQQVNFTFTPDSGQFQLNFNGNLTPAILYSDNAATVQSYLTSLPGGTGITVSGSFVAGFLVTFAGAAGSQNQPLLLIVGNTLAASSAPVTIDITVCQPGIRPASNTLNGVTPVVITPTTTTDAISPEPNWANAVGIVDLCP